MGRYYVGDMDTKFTRITTSVRIRTDHLDRVKLERFNLSNFIEDCLDYYWGMRSPEKDLENLQRIADAVKKAIPRSISKEIKEIKVEMRKRVFCPQLSSDVYEDFFKGDLCLFPNCESYKRGLCRFSKPTDDE